MHTLRITLIGLILLSLFVFVAAQINRRKNRPAVDGAYLFIWVWLVASITNFCVGVCIVGYSVLTELGVHVVVFDLSAGVAWFLSRKFRVENAKGQPCVIATSTKLSGDVYEHRSVRFRKLTWF